MNERDVSWMLHRPVSIDAAADGDHYHVAALDGTRECELTIAGNRLLFNGRYVDVRDDYPCYLGLIDAAEASETGTAVIAG